MDHIEMNSRTVISNKTIIKGDLTCSSDCIIEGVLQGKLRSEGQVEVASSGRVEGEVDAATLVCEGEIMGDANVEGRASLGENACIDGALICGQLLITPSAKIKKGIRFVTK